MSPTLILFDLEGTLLDGALAARAAMEQAFQRIFGVIAQARGGGTDLQMFAAMAERSGVTLQTATLTRLLPAYYDVLERTLATAPPLLLPGVPRLVATLAAEPRCRLALATGNLHGGAQRKLARCGLDRAFPTGGFGDDGVHPTEVAATAWREADRHYGITFEARATVLVGDAAEDVQAARLHGFRAMAVGTGRGGPGPAAEARPDVLFPDLTDTRRIISWLLD